MNYWTVSSVHGKECYKCVAHANKAVEYAKENNNNRGSDYEFGEKFFPPIHGAAVKQLNTDWVMEA